MKKSETISVRILTLFHLGVICCCAFGSCNNKKSEKVFDEQEYYSAYTVHPLTKDSILIRSRLNTLEACQTGIKNGVEYGEHFCNYPNGKRKVEGNYLNGEKYENWTFYHENGQPKKRTKYWQDNPTLDQIEYDRLGRPQRYRFIDNDNDIYVIEYNEGKIVNIVGDVPFCVSIIDSLSTESKLRLVSYLGAPPSLISFTILKAVLVDIEANKSLEEIQVLPVGKEIAEWRGAMFISQFVMEGHGKYEIDYYFQVADSSDNQLSLDTVIFPARISIPAH